jgi:hypothetical protein
VLSLGSGCGGDDDSCGIKPCGGTIAAGRYRIASTCVAFTEPLKVEGCEAGFTINAHGLKYDGTLTFNVDKSYEASTTVSGTFTEQIPASCLASNGITVSCAQLSQLVLNNSSDSFSAVSCSGTTSCTCRFTLKPQGPNTVTGTYAENGTNLVLTGPDGSSSNPYCATATQVSLQSATMPGDMMPDMDMPNGVFSMVLTKE